MSKEMNKENMKITEAEELEKIAGGDNGATRTDTDPNNPRYRVGQFVSAYVSGLHAIPYGGYVIKIKYDTYKDSKGNVFKCNQYLVRSDVFPGILKALNTERWHTADSIENNGQ